MQSAISDHSDSMFLPKPVAKAFLPHVENLLVHYTKLANAADSAGDLLWNLPAKFHWLWHLGQRAQFINPRVSSTLWTRTSWDK